MESEWSAVPLEDVADLSGGFAFKSEDYASEGRFILRTLNIKEDGSINREDAVFLPLDKCCLYKRFELQEHDTLFVMVGATLGKVGYVRRETLPALLNQNMWRIRARNGRCDPRYLQYAFRHTASKNLGWASGSARDFVRRDDYRKMEVPLPPLPEQKAIAAVLGALDDKIELNRRMNATLEAMARALFQSWFVDAAENGLPKGWREATIGEVAENPRRGIDANAIAPETPYIALEHMPRRCIALSEWRTAGGLESNKFEFERGEILFGKLRPYFHKVGVAPIAGVCSTDILVIRPKQAQWFGFVLGHVSSVVLVNHTDVASTGTKMPRTSWNDIAEFEVALPSETIAARFTAAIEPLIQRIIANIHEARTLSTIRDALLPKLLGGQLASAT